MAKLVIDVSDTQIAAATLLAAIETKQNQNAVSLNLALNGPTVSAQDILNRFCNNALNDMVTLANVNRTARIRSKLEAAPDTVLNQIEGLLNG